MMLALIIGIVVVVGGLAYGYPTQLGTRLATMGTTAAILGLWLAAAIGRVAAIRFTSAEDIDGEDASDRVRQAGAVLRNTLEQAALALFAQVALAIVVDRSALVLGLHAALFTIGRTLFWVGYPQGAQGRAFGFALTFYPSVLMLLATVVALVSR